MHSLVGEPSPRSCRVSLVSSRLVLLVVHSLVFWMVDLGISLYASLCEWAANIAPV